jgi:hypothetical protein
MNSMLRLKQATNATFVLEHASLFCYMVLHALHCSVIQLLCARPHMYADAVQLNIVLTHHIRKLS